MQISAQFAGTVVSQEGEPLPYASVYIKETSIGTCTNEAGKFELDIDSVECTIMVSYIGYKTLQYSCTELISSGDLVIIMKRQNYSTPQIEIVAGEDPAYAVMRKAIKRREEHHEKIKKYDADMYIKGTVKILDAPEKFLGRSTDRLSEYLDSTGQGLIYLSESKSRYYHLAPHRRKEVMYASKVSGAENGISFNMYETADIDFYDEYIEFGRSLISPLADVAFSYYRFRHDGSFTDEEGRKINRIKVIPKKNRSPSFFGTIYIIEDSWNLYGTELSFTGKASKEAFFDTISVSQTFIPSVEGWLLFTQRLDFSAHLFTFKFTGRFTYSFSSFDLNPSWDDDFMDNEILNIDKAASKKSSEFWDLSRPIPLSIEEKEDYTRKDSLETLWKSKHYLDSVDRISNALSWTDLIFGYTRRESFKNKEYTFKSPLTSLQFNPVEGFTSTFSLDYRDWNESFTGYFKVKPEVSYGFADRKMKFSISIESRLNSIDRTFYAISAGRKISQFNDLDPVSKSVNTFQNLLFKDNDIKIYQKEFISGKYQKELLNGLFMWSGVEYVSRKPLVINTNYSFFRGDQIYPSNHPVSDNDYFPSFKAHKAVTLTLGLRLRINQKFLSLPDQKIYLGSRYPDLILRYRRGSRLFNSASNYDFIKLMIRDRNVNTKEYGYFSYVMQYGLFLNKERLEFIDYHHFSGNESTLGYYDNNLSRYLFLDIYYYSTNENFVAGYFTYHFDGFITERLPLLRSTPLKLFMSSNGFYINQETYYHEYLFGLENFLIGPLSLFEIGYGWGFDRNGLFDRGFKIRLNRMIGAG